MELERTPRVAENANRVRWGTKQPYANFGRPRIICSFFYHIKGKHIMAWGMRNIAICLFGAPSVMALAKGFTLNLKYIILFAALLIITNIKPLKKLHPLVFIAASAVIGIVFEFSN